MPSAEQLAGTFATFFLENVTGGDTNTLAGSFSDDAAVVFVDGASQQVFVDAGHRHAALFGYVSANSQSTTFTVESVSGSAVEDAFIASIFMVASTESVVKRHHLTAFLSPVLHAEDTFTVRQMTLTTVSTEAVVANVVIPAAEVVYPVEDVRAPEPAAPAAPAVVESPPAESTKPKRGMKGKKAHAAATAPVEEVSAVPAPAAVVEEAPAVVVAQAPVVPDAPKEVAVETKKEAPANSAPAAPEVKSSWASLARKNPQPSASHHVPVRVSPPPEGGVAAEAAPAHTEAPPTRPRREPRPQAEILDKVMFQITKPVTEEEIKSKIGAELCQSIVSLRIVNDKLLVFIDFSIADALTKLKELSPVIGGAKINPYKQRPKE